MCFCFTMFGCCLQNQKHLAHCKLCDHLSTAVCWNSVCDAIRRLSSHKTGTTRSRMHHDARQATQAPADQELALIRMHFAKVGMSVCRAQLDLQEASTEACSPYRDQDQCGSVPTASNGLCSWHPGGWQGPLATEGGWTGPPSVSAFHMLQYQIFHQKSQSQVTARNPLQLGTSSKESRTHEKFNPT